MKRLFLVSALVASGLLSSETPSFAHGGQYRGPGDTVPPGGNGGGGGGGPASAGPAGPAAPAPGATGRPGAARPGAPASAGMRHPVTGPGDTGADLTLWTFWWEFNREPYLDLRTAIQNVGPTRDSEGWFFGRGQSEGKDSLRPTDQQVRQTVVPALLAALENEKNNDIVTGCLIALAKIGDDKRAESGESRFERIIADRLDDSVQEISETAAVALGILANDSSVPILASLLKDDEQGRKLVGGQEVNYRTRAFAAYGLALIGAHTGDEAVRKEIVGYLHDVLETDQTKSFDLGTACVVALGLVPLETIETPAPDREAKEKDKEASASSPAKSRTAQIDYLLGYLANADHNYLVRAHAPTAVARLLDPPAEKAGRLPEELYASYKERFVEDLLGRLEAGERNEVLESCVLALGLVGDADSDKIDAKIRAALASVPEDVKDQQARNYAMISMAKIGGTPGNGDIEAGLDEVSKFLLEHITSGKASIQPWTGLAIGVLCNELVANKIDSPVTAGLKEALRTTLAAEKDDQKIGAYAIGAGIAGDIEAKGTLHEHLDKLSADEPRGYVAVALGLMGDRDAIAPIQRIVSESKYRPDLLKQAAIGLGLLGDKNLVLELVKMLNEAPSLATQAAIASALGRIGDQRSIDPLVAMLQNEELTASARGFAAVALGIVADKEQLPWNSKIGVDLNYRASTTTLNDQNGTGILNIL